MLYNTKVLHVVIWPMVNDQDQVVVQPIKELHIEPRARYCVNNYKDRTHFGGVCVMSLYSLIWEECRASV